MENKRLSLWLKFVLIGVGLCEIACCGIGLPVLGQFIAVAEQGLFDHLLLPWLVFLWIAALPAIAALFFAWKVADNIGVDRSFSLSSANLIRWIGRLAAADALYLFLGNVTYLLLGMNHPGVFLLIQIPVFVVFAIAIAAFSLSRLVHRAAELQEQSDLTI